MVQAVSDCQASGDYPAGDLLRTMRLGQETFYIRHIKPFHPSYPDVKQRVAERFLQKFQARISAFFPEFVVMTDADGAMLGAAGLRNAAQGSLFLEQYLQQPIEAHIGESFKAGDTPMILPVRKHIVEVGNLASFRAGMARLLFVALTDIFVSWQYHWLSFTGTQSVYNAFQMLGLKPIKLCDARQEDLKDNKADWGTYYDHKPQVMIGDILGGYHALQKSRMFTHLDLQDSEEANYVFSA